MRTKVLAKAGTRRRSAVEGLACTRPGSCSATKGRAAATSNQLKINQGAINAQTSHLQQLQALAKLKRDQVNALKVRAGTVACCSGVSAGGPAGYARIEHGASCRSGVAQAELKIAETQIKDVRPVNGEVDTRNGVFRDKSRVLIRRRVGTLQLMHL